MASGPARSSTLDMMDLDSVPLFMRDLPPEESIASNVALEALQNLVFEGTPDEQARNFKERGNEYYKQKRYREAVSFYTQGVEVKPTDPTLKEALLLNRALCNLELKNFGWVLRDTSATLQSNPKSSKAFYRASCALESLERYDEALDACVRCLAFDSNNASMIAHKERLMQSKQAWDRKEEEKAERLRKENQERRVIAAAYQALHLIVISTGRPNPHSQYTPHFDPKFNGFRTIATPVLFPVYLRYPQYNTSDLIAEFDPSSTFASHLAMMFPPTPGLPVAPPHTQSTQHTPAPHWDEFGQYTAQNLSIYAVTHRNRILKIGKRMTLRDACDAAANVPPGHEKDGLELVDESLSFKVVPKGETERLWVEDFKRMQAAGAFGQS